MYHLLFHSKSHLFANTVTSLCYSRYLAPYNYCEGFIIVYDNKEQWAYLPDKSARERTAQADRFYAQESTYNLYLQECAGLKKLYHAFYDNLPNNFSECDNVTISSLFQSLLNLQARCASLYQGTHEQAIQTIVDKLQIELKKYTNDWQSVLGQLSVARSPEMINEQRAFKKLNKTDDDRLLKHIVKYPWVCAKAFFFSEAIEGLKEMIKHREIKNELSFAKKLKWGYLLKHQKIESMVAKLRRLGVLRIELKALLCHKLLGSRLYEEIARRLNIEPIKLFYTFDADEIIKLLNSKNPARHKIINGPRVYMGHGTSYRMFVGKKANVIIAGLKTKVDRTELKGLAVSSGKVRGQARIILPSQLKEMTAKTFNPGDILITSMTNPNMIFLMSKSAGVITDEGGITCHAAIICREFKKPCVVGTRHATKIFKDGDLVEIDANIGVVRKI